MTRCAVFHRRGFSLHTKRWTAKGAPQRHSLSQLQDDVDFRRCRDWSLPAVGAPTPLRAAAVEARWKNLTKASAYMVSSEAMVSGCFRWAPAFGTGAAGYGRTIAHGMPAHCHDRTGRKSDELQHFRHYRFFAGRRPACAASRFRAPAGQSAHPFARPGLPDERATVADG